MESFDAELRAAFVEEAREILAAVEVCLLDVEAKAATGETWEELARAAHNLKGSARAVGLEAVASLAHEFETALGALKAGQGNVGNLLRLRDELLELVDPKTPGDSVRVSVSRLNDLVNVLEDLLTTVDRSSAAEVKKSLRLARDTALSLRMVPVQSLFRKMDRVVREVSAQLGKQVELNLEGGDTELDKAIVEEIQDPVMHLVHNALDHGIDGKGTVTLRAFPKGSKFILECRDDGRGIDKARVRARAEKLGWVKAGEVLSEAELFSFLLRPGFSTAEKVTAVSGRGIGMDVVKETVSRLKGSLAIESEAGKGTVFRLTLPLFISLVDGWVVGAGGRRYVIPLSQVEGVTRAEKGTPHFDDLLGRKTTGPARELPALRVRQGMKSISVAVDELIGPQSLVSHPFGKELQGIPGLSGGALLPDGGLALIVNFETVPERAA